MVTSRSHGWTFVVANHHGGNVLSPVAKMVPASMRSTAHSGPVSNNLAHQPTHPTQHELLQQSARPPTRLTHSYCNPRGGQWQSKWQVNGRSHQWWLGTSAAARSGLGMDGWGWHPTKMGNTSMQASWKVNVRGGTPPVIHISAAVQYR